MGRPHRSTTRPPITGGVPRLTPLIVVVILSLFALLIYANTFSAPFQFDDAFNITGNAKIQHLTNFLTLAGTRDVGFLSFALNYAVGGVTVFGYHLVNILVHIANGFLVYTLILFLITAACTPKPAAAPWIALATAILFVVHPVQTQSVTYIVQRFSSLVTTFYLLTIVCYLKWRMSAPDAKFRVGWYAAAFCSCVLAMKTKENSFTLPVMLLLVEGVFFRDKKWLAIIPFLLTLPFIPLAHPGTTIGADNGLPTDAPALNRLEYLCTQFRVIVTYLRLLVLPIQQNLDYDYPTYRSLLAPPVAASFLLLSSFMGLAVVLLRRAATSSSSGILRLMAFGIFWFFLTLSIESSIIPIKDVIFEHRIYLPSIGFFLVTCLWGAWLWERWPGIRWLVVLIAVVAVCGFSVATVQRNRVWQDPVTLWQDVVRKAPDKARGHERLASALSSQRRMDDAIREYQTALQLHPEYPSGIHANLGVIHNMRGRFADAVREFQTAIALNPKDAENHNNLGVTYKDQGHLEEAIQEYQIALTLKPDHAEAHSNLGVAYKAQGKNEEAIQEYQTALRINPDFAAAHDNLGVAYQELGRIPEATLEAQTAVRLKPDYAEAHNNLGVVYTRQGRIGEAIREFETAVQLQPNFFLARYNLGGAYQSKGMRAEARREFERVLKTKPDFQAARQALDAMPKEASKP